MFVSKKDRTPRIIINYKQLNSTTEDDTNKTLYQKQKQEVSKDYNCV